ncbi:ABC transporter ATP-binding protein [Kribbella sp. NPDC048915]|uniref:ABC transporter ATP-binding protein n=1 Tax=Kribbella sp. NPDC048915 TaxID=3155148 RepID=UPI0033E3008E
MTGLLGFVRLAWRAGRGLTILTVTAIVGSAAAPLGIAVSIGQVVAGITGDDSRRATAWAVAGAACLLLQWFAGALLRVSATALGDRVDAALQHDLMRAVFAPGGVRRLEDPATAALVEVGRDTLRADWARPGRLASTLGGLATGRIVLLASAVVLAGFRWWLGVGLLVVGVWAAYEDRVASRAEAGHHYGASESARRMRYFNDLGTTPPAAQEIRVFGLSGFIVDRHRETWTATMRRVLTRPGPRPLAATAFLGVVVLGGIALVAAEASAGQLSAGATATYVQSFLIALGGIQQSSWTGLQTELALATLKRYDDALQAVAPARPPITGGTRPATGMPQHEIAFHSVSFSYPNTSRQVLRELDLVIPAGRSLAIVGANGAGKTSLVKLLCGLYEPTQGTITVDGAELRDLREWHRRLAVGFQHSVRLPMSAYENVRFGRPPGDLWAAVDRAGATSLVEELPDRWDTILSAEFDSGVDLSGGQWQKVGLARALYAVDRGATVLILDEPAAQLDARAEAELYRRFLELTAGLTTILVSHRFSTVRQASSIVVLDDGGIIEQGSHDELLDLDGTYARLFRLQAVRFEDLA